MKNLTFLLIILIGLLYAQKSTAQEYPVNKSFTSNQEQQIPLMVDAGKDTIVCSGNTVAEGDERISIGGNPTVTGGVAPYAYTWSGARKRFPASKYLLYASDILEDTTQRNPTFKRSSAPEDWFTFHLKVEDSEHNVGYDSVRIRSSRFVISLAGPHWVGISSGDSVQLIGNPYIEGNFPLVRYAISPSHGLSDSTDIYGWAKPERNIRYNLQAIDSIGCKCREVPYLDIEVDTFILSNNILTGQAAQCYLSQEDLIIQLPQKQREPYEVNITTTNGTVIYSGKYSEREIKLTGLHLKKNQVYIVSIADEKETLVMKVMGN